MTLIESIKCVLAEYLRNEKSKYFPKNDTDEMVFDRLRSFSTLKTHVLHWEHTDEDLLIARQLLTVLTIWEAAIAKNELTEKDDVIPLLRKMYIETNPNTPPPYGLGLHSQHPLRTYLNAVLLTVSLNDELMNIARKAG